MQSMKKKTCLLYVSLQRIDTNLKEYTHGEILKILNAFHIQERILSLSKFYSLSAPLIELVQDEFVQSKVEEAAKLFYTSQSVTINLAGIAAAGLLLLLLLVPLLALLFQPSAAPAVSTGYGPPEPSYGAPEPAYGAPEHGYSRSVSNCSYQINSPKE